MKLTINADKTVFMTFKNKNKKMQPINVEMEGRKIREVDDVKYLGLTIDKNLTFAKHIESIKNKICPLVGAIRRSGLLNNYVANTIYKSIILSQIMYMCAIWSNATQTQLNAMEILQKKAIKLLYKIPFRTPTTELYEKLDLLSIKEIIHLERCKMMYRIKNNLFKYNNNLAINKEIHQHFTRKRNQYHIHTINTNKGRGNTQYNCAIAFNSLKEETKCSTNIKTLAKSLIQDIKTNREEQKQNIYKA